MIAEAIQHYHQLLTEKHLSSTIEILQSSNERLSVAGRPVCTVFRPFFVTAESYRFIKNASTLVMKGISALCARLMEDPGLRQNMDLTPAEETIIHVNSGYGLPTVSGRLDGFLAADNAFQFVEYNSDSPGGIGYGDVLTEVFSSMPILKDFTRRYSCETIPVRSLVFHSLLRAYHQWGGKGLPAIAIIDWKDTPTYPEFLLFQEFFEKHGCRVKIGDPRELEYRNGRLYLGDFAIELVYKRLVVGEMLDRLGTENVLVQAARDRAVCVANGFELQLAFRKNLFALLSDPVHSNLFEESVQNAIRMHIPWTRKVREGKTDYEGQIVDLPPFVLRSKDSLVLKPGGEYGGKGVVLGWETSEAEWEQALNRALADSYVVQKRVAVGSEVYPSLVDGNLNFAERYFDLDPYVWNGLDIEGCGIRLSRVALLNVSAGGGSATPMFIVR